MKIITDKKKIALHYKNLEITYKDFILNTKKLKNFTDIEKFTNNMIYMENRPELLYSFFAVLMHQVQLKNYLTMLEILM